MKLDESRNENVTLIATLCQHTYESLTKRMTQHLHQWMDCIGTIKALKATDIPSSYDKDENELSVWELAVRAGDDVDQSEKPTVTSNLFKVVRSVDCNHESYQQIIWNL